MRPSREKSMYTGIIVTCPGSIRVARTRRKSNFRPGKRKRAKAKAARELEKTTPTTDSSVILIVLK